MGRYGMGLRLQILAALVASVVLAFGLLAIATGVLAERALAKNRLAAGRSIARAVAAYDGGSGIEVLAWY